MAHQQVEYKGYVILPIAIPEGEDMVFEGYEISNAAVQDAFAWLALPPVFGCATVTKAGRSNLSAIR